MLEPQFSGSVIPVPDHGRPALCPNHFSVGDLLPARVLGLLKNALFAKKCTYYFLKTADCAPFGLILHELTSKKMR